MTPNSPQQRQSDSAYPLMVVAAIGAALMAYVWADTWVVIGSNDAVVFGIGAGLVVGGLLFLLRRTQ